MSVHSYSRGVVCVGRVCVIVTGSRGRTPPDRKWVCVCFVRHLLGREVGGCSVSVCVCVCVEGWWDGIEPISRRSRYTVWKNTPVNSYFFLLMFVFVSYKWLSYSSQDLPPAGTETFKTWMSLVKGSSTGTHFLFNLDKQFRTDRLPALPPPPRNTLFQCTPARILSIILGLPIRRETIITTKTSLNTAKTAFTTLVNKTKKE